MEELLSTYSNPYVLIVSFILAVISTYYCWIGLRRKSPGLFVVGLGLGIPTFNATLWWLWALGIIVTVGGIWVARQT